MKQFAFILVTLLALSCSKDNETVYSVTPELTSYVDKFYAEAAARNKTLPKNNLIVSLDSGCQSITEISKDGDQITLNFKTGFAQNLSSDQIESIMFHELGKIVLQREIIKTPLPNDPNPVSLMNPYYKFNGFNLAERSVLLDELFK